MSKTGVIILILIIVAVGLIFWLSQGNSNVAPVSDNTMPPVDTNTASPATTTSTVDTSIDVGLSTGTTKEFTVSGQDFSFSPSTINVNKGDTVKIIFNNLEGTHDFKIEGYNVGTSRISGGQSESFTFTADKSGSFEYYCSVGQHRAMGMKGTLVVK